MGKEKDIGALLDALIRCEGLLSELDRDLPGDAVCGHAMETTLDIARDALAKAGRCVHPGCVNEYVEVNPLWAPGPEGNDPGCLEGDGGGE